MILRSPTQVCEISRFTSRSVIVTFPVTFIVETAGGPGLSGIPIKGLVDSVVVEKQLAS